MILICHFNCQRFVWHNRLNFVAVDCQYLNAKSTRSSSTDLSTHHFSFVCLYQRRILLSRGRCDEIYEAWSIVGQFEIYFSVYSLFVKSNATCGSDLVLFCSLRIGILLVTNESLSLIFNLIMSRR